MTVLGDINIFMGTTDGELVAKVDLLCCCVN
jgi:hypothetical protein